MYSFCSFFEMIVWKSDFYAYYAYFDFYCQMLTLSAGIDAEGAK